MDMPNDQQASTPMAYGYLSCRGKRYPIKKHTIYFGTDLVNDIRIYRPRIHLQHLKLSVRAVKKVESDETDGQLLPFMFILRCFHGTVLSSLSKDWLLFYFNIALFLPLSGTV